MMTYSIFVGKEERNAKTKTGKSHLQYDISRVTNVKGKALCIPGRRSMNCGENGRRKL